VQANESLYNRATAQKLDLSKQAIFGPQSSHFRYDQRMLRAAEIAQARALLALCEKCASRVEDDRFLPVDGIRKAGRHRIAGQIRIQTNQRQEPI